MQSDIARAVEIFMPAGSVKELRILTDEGMMTGYFDKRRSLATTAKEMSELDGVKAVYWGLNAINPKTLKYITNDVARRSFATRFENIACRKWLLIDVDPVRPKSSNATDAEKAEAWNVTVAVQEFLRSLGWPEPVVVDSSNGFHSLFPIYLPAEDATTVKDVLRVLSWKFSSEGAIVDTAVHDACRIVKVPGTMGRKGPHSEDRPWRQSRLLSAPAISRRLTYLDLTALQRYAPPAPPKKTVIKASISQERLEEFFESYEDFFKVIGRDVKDGCFHYYLDVCPFNDFAEHSNHGLRKTAIIVSDDSVGFSCFADQCAGEYTFDDLLELLADECEEPKFQIDDFEKMEKSFAGMDYLGETSGETE
jgi:hypothetical protein